MIYAGELFYLVDDGQVTVGEPEGSWSKVYVVLLNDLLLVTRLERDNYLTVLEEPIVLDDITAIRWNCASGTKRHESAPLSHLVYALACES